MCGEAAAFCLDWPINRLGNSLPTCEFFAAEDQALDNDSRKGDRLRFLDPDLSDLTH